MIRQLLRLAMMVAVCAAPVAAQKTAHPIVANIDARQTAEPVSNYVFGMFIERIGKTMYGPLWAEVLDDRKFYFPISSKEDEPEPRRPWSQACSSAINRSAARRENR